MRDILQQIKWAYQRVMRNYDDRVFWGFDSEFLTYLKPIRQFCNQELKEDYMQMEENKNRKEILLKTLDLLGSLELDKKNSTPKFWEHFGKNIEFFWD